MPRSGAVNAPRSAPAGIRGVLRTGAAKEGNSGSSCTAAGSADARKICSRSGADHIAGRSSAFPTWKLGRCSGRKSVTTERGGMGRALRMRAGIPEPRLGGNSCQSACGGQGSGVESSKMPAGRVLSGKVFSATGFMFFQSYLISSMGIIRENRNEYSRLNALDRSPARFITSSVVLRELRSLSVRRIVSGFAGPGRGARRCGGRSF